MYSDECQKDAELVSQYRSGNEPAFAELVARHLQDVVRLVHGYVHDQPSAEDVTQEVFVKAWKHLASFDTNASFRTWLFAIAKNTALDFLKKKQTVSFSALSDEHLYQLEVATAVAPEHQQFDNADYFSGLGERDRTILDLHYTQGFRFQEIADRLNRPMDTVKTWHRRAIQRLKKRFFSEE